MRQPTDVLVVGGGPAGAAAAAAVAEAGRAVVLIERTSGPHDKVCGEFISHEAALYLAALGVDAVALGAEAIEAVRLSAGGLVATAALPFPALSLSRRVLDEALLARAAALGACVRRGVRVRKLERRPSGDWQARLDGGEPISGRAAFLATGKHDLKEWRRPPGRQSDLVAFKMHWRLAPEQAAGLARHVELTLFTGGYAGLEPIEGGRANLCLLVRRRRLAEGGASWSRLIAAIRAENPLLDGRLSGATPCWPRPLAIASIPYGYVLPAADGPFRLGDQAAVIPSFAGDGLAIALHSARLAARCHLGGGGAADYRRRVARDIGQGVRFATFLSHFLVRQPGQRILAMAARLQPRLMAIVAGATRVPEAALCRAGLELSSLT